MSFDLRLLETEAYFRRRRALFYYHLTLNHSRRYKFDVDEATISLALR